MIYIFTLNISKLVINIISVKVIQKRSDRLCMRLCTFNKFNIATEAVPDMRRDAFQLLKFD